MLCVFVVAGLAGCDSSETPPEPEFQAEITGDVNRSINGKAGMSDSEEFDQQFRGAFRLFPTLVADSLRPDSLQLPDSLQTPPATLLILTAEDENGYGQTITATFPGDSIPAPGEYELGLQVDTSMVRFGFSTGSITAAYLDSQPDSFLVAGATGGTITIERSTAQQIRGRFTLETERALRITGLGSTTQPLGPQNFDVPPFNTTIQGRFTALRNADTEPLLPLGGVGVGL